MALRGRVDAVLDAIEALTASAREKLTQYQQMKQATESLLDEAGADFIEADKMLKQAAGLAGMMTRLRREQRKLDRAALCSDAEPEQLKELRRELKAIGADVHVLRMYRSWGRPLKEVEAG